MGNLVTRNRVFLFFLLIFFVLNPVSAQFKDSEKIKSLHEKIEENRRILLNNPDKWFNDADDLMSEAVEYRDIQNEMLLLGHYCLYYLYISDLDGLLRVCKSLKIKAKESGNVRYEALSHIYLQEAYSKNKLFDEAQSEFEKAIELLKKTDETDEILDTKGNAYTHMLNMYLNQGKPREALVYAQAVTKLLSRLEDDEKRMKNQYRNFSHVAVCFQSFNPDSAIYYIQKSFETKPEAFPNNDDVSLLNYTMLGEIYTQKKDYEKALSNFKTAERLWQGNPGLINSRALLYKGFAEVYGAISDVENENRYKLKLKELELKISEQKNLSLHAIIKDKEKESGSGYLEIIIIIGSLLIFSLVYFLIRLNKKNKILKFQERQSVSYFNNDRLNSDREEIYKELVEMFKRQDPGFMNEFSKAFPYFAGKLLEISSSMTETEIEFSALLKLNMPTKEIAKYKNLEPKTIQNRKYRIRKKMNIPNNVDIYFFFSQF